MIKDKRLGKAFANIEESKNLIQEVLDESNLGIYDKELIKKLERYQSELLMFLYRNN